MKIPWLDRLEELHKTLPPATNFGFGKVREGEMVVGKIPDDILPLFTLTPRIKERARKMHNDHRATHAAGCVASGSCEVSAKEIECFLDEAEACREFFWIALHREIEVPKIGWTGIRQNFVVVCYPETPESRTVDMEEVIESFLDLLAPDVRFPRN
jgi:hypothetical protein